MFSSSSSSSSIYLRALIVGHLVVAFHLGVVLVSCQQLELDDYSELGGGGVAAAVEPLNQLFQQQQAGLGQNNQAEEEQEEEALNDPCAIIRCGFGSSCQVQSDGRAKCVCPSACPLVVSPFCADDGKTYGNTCFMRVQACNEQRPVPEVVHKGACTNDKTNNNQQGARPTTAMPQRLSTKISPGIGVSSTTRKNPCDSVRCAYGATCQVSNNGRAQCVCAIACPAIVAPVCAEDRKTYDNECLIRVSACRNKKPAPKVLHTGKCVDKSDHQGSSPSSSRSSKRCSSFCPQIYAPFCASDGQTYGNECFMRLAACRANKPVPTVLYKGQCRNGNQARSISSLPANQTDDLLLNLNNKTSDATDCPSTCPLSIEDPVCADDGQTYKSECFMRLENCSQKKLVPKKVYQGECRRDDQALISAMPTVGNGTRIASDASQVLGDDSTCPSFNCSQTSYEPICADDGETYGNECIMRRQACKKYNFVPKILHDGECTEDDPKPRSGSRKTSFKPENSSPEPKCPDFCPQVELPFCADDGRTYGNECFMRLQACRANKPIPKKIHDGQCCNKKIKKLNPSSPSSTLPSKIQTTPPPSSSSDTAASKSPDCPDFCPQVYDPVCADDGKTYSNTCVMVVDACKEQRPKPNVVSKGKCGEGSVVSDKLDGLLTKFFNTTSEIGITSQIGNTSEIGTISEIGNISAIVTNATTEGYAHQESPTVIGDSVVNRDPCALVKCDYGAACEVISGKGTCGCTITCPRYFAPICADDGKTYAGECYMRAQACWLKKPSPKFVHVGACKNATEGTASFPPVSPPKVCQHHHQQHNNKLANSH